MNIIKFIAPCFIYFGCFARCLALDCSITQKGSEDDLTRLQINVICNHSDYDVRPVKGNTTITTVDIQFQPKHVSIVEEKEIMKVTGFLKMKWRHEYWQWKPADYGLIEQVEVDHYDMWRPKLTTADQMQGLFQYYQRIISISRLNGIEFCTQDINFSFKSDTKTDYKESETPFELKEDEIFKSFKSEIESCSLNKQKGYTSGWYEFLDETDIYAIRQVLVDFRGFVDCLMVVTLYGPCSFDISKWPDDEWSCELTLGKRSEENGYVVVHFVNNSALDLSNLEKDKDWEIIKITDPAIEDVDQRSEFVALRVSLGRERGTVQRIYLIPAFVALAMTVVPLWLADKIFFRLAIHFLATFLQVLLLQFVFSFVSKSHGLRFVAIYDLYLNGLYLNLLGVVLAAINAKYDTTTEDPPEFVVRFLSTLVSVPCLGTCCAFVMNDGGEKACPFDADDDGALISSKTGANKNKKWRAFLNFVDKCVFFLVLFYVCVRAML